MTVGGDGKSQGLNEQAKGNDQSVQSAGSMAKCLRQLSPWSMQKEHCQSGQGLASPGPWPGKRNQTSIWNLKFKGLAPNSRADHLIT